MAPSAVTICNEIRGLIRDRKFAEALTNLRSIDKSWLPKTELGQYCLLFAEASLHTGDYSYVPVDEAIGAFRQSTDTDGFAQAKFLKGWWLTVQGRHIDAKESLLEAYTGFLRADNQLGAARALNRLAYAALQLGDLSTAGAPLEMSQSSPIYRQLSGRQSGQPELQSLKRDVK